MHKARSNRLALVQALYRLNFDDKTPLDCMDDHRFFVERGLCAKCEYRKVEFILDFYKKNRAQVSEILSSYGTLPKSNDLMLTSLVEAAACELLCLKESIPAVIASEYTAVGKILLSEKFVSIVNALVDGVVKKISND